MRDALALIKAYEQKIEELTEENERLRAIPEQLYKEMSERIVEERKIERKLAIQKVQERLKAQKFTHKNFGELVYVDDIDQIAKEMLEEQNEDKK
jgi:UDP-galactopyranose mutase